MNNDKWYYLDKKHQTFGAYSSQSLMELYRRKVISDKSYVWKNGFEDWTRFKDIISSGAMIDLSLATSSEKLMDVQRQADVIDNVEYVDPSVNNDFSTATSQLLNQIDYAAPYEVVWITDDHKQSVTQFTRQLVQNLIEQRKLESFRLSPTKPDGLIIGTGEADFTKGNVPYEFNYREKTFQLIDVPGIEGNEGKYEHLVKQAIEKAHLVIYVNGTNKKPEEVTARKIKMYINQYAKIYAILNVRGKADNYEFEEDQVSLTKTHGDIEGVLDQTLTVLKQNIGSDLIEGGQCLQGLLAFSALAFDQEQNETTISFSRKDLIKSQKSYKKDFGSLEKMKSFSQVNTFEEKIISKFSTFEQDIVESNKRKIVRKIEEVIDVIQEQLKIHLELQTKIKKELDIGKDSIVRALTDFNHNLSNKLDNAVSYAFSNIIDDGCNVIEHNFGEKDIISSKIQNIVDNESKTLARKIEEIKQDVNQQFKNNLKEIMQRVDRSIEQVQMNFDLEHSQDLSFSIQMSNTSMFDASSIGKGLLEIGGMTAMGAGLGTAFPVIGNVIGAIGGFLVGVWSFFSGFLSSKQSKINKAQSQFRTNVNSAQSNFKSQVRNSANEMASSVRENTEENVIAKIYIEYDKMRDIECILTSQIEKLSTLSNQIKSKGYGTI